MPRPVVVAVPVRDEAARIGACLAALSDQTIPADHVVVLLNNCTDGTAEVAKASPLARHRLHIIERRLEGASANAGFARGLAMQYAASLVKDGAILTTDADAEVPPHWIEANLRAIEQGADAVCGQAVIDPIEAMVIPAHLHQDDAREVAYGRLLDEIESIVLPDPGDSWPRHREDSGASIAITTSMFRRVGGVPRLASGEDRALIAALRLIDARVRHHPHINVVVSGRIEGRAPGGMADTMRRRMVKQDEYVDDRIEPARLACLRVRMKRRFHSLWHEPDDARLQQLANLLDLSSDVLADAVDAAYLGLGWSQVEQAAPVLTPRRVRFAELPREMRIALRIQQHLLSRAGFGEWDAELTAA